MKRILHKIIASAIMLIALQITLTAQPVGSQIKTDTSGHISYWNGVDAWIPVAPGLPGQTLKFTAGVPSWNFGISTTIVTNITGTTAASGGNVISDGGTKVIARGVCWSTTPNPTILDNKTFDSIGIGVFNSNLFNLNYGTTYHIRSYATNNTGTSYGNDISFTTQQPNQFAIGQNYQGGIIAYILQPGDSGYVTGETHGIIVAPFDQSTEVTWSNGWPIGMPTGIDIGSGYANTNTIVANHGDGGSYAAKICYDLVLNGYSDWYLPSIIELSKIYMNRNAIGGFTSNKYWSSSQYDVGINFAYAITFGTGYTNGDNYKNGIAYIRAARSF